MTDEKSSIRIFISHSHKDEKLADALVSFLSAVGIPQEVVFCTSVPGNGVTQKISEDIKNALKHSLVNIAILSRNYYESAYCVNEAGVMWYVERPIILIALPEIDKNKLKGFLGSDYLFLDLERNTDISKIYDTVRKHINGEKGFVCDIASTVVTREMNKLIENYKEYIKCRNQNEAGKVSPIHNALNINNKETAMVKELVTDDEKVIMYYILRHKRRKVTKADTEKWLCENEIIGVDVDNGFDLLSKSEGGDQMMY